VFEFIQNFTQLKTQRDCLFIHPSIHGKLWIWYVYSRFYMLDTVHLELWSEISSRADRNTLICCKSKGNGSDRSLLDFVPKYMLKDSIKIDNIGFLSENAKNLLVYHWSAPTCDCPLMLQTSAMVPLLNIHILFYRLWASFTTLWSVLRSKCVIRLS
jgi:hypothetical protein